MTRTLPRTDDEAVGPAPAVAGAACAQCRGEGRRGRHEGAGCVGAAHRSSFPTGSPARASPPRSLPRTAGMRGRSEKVSRGSPSAHSGRAELDGDPRADRPGRLGHAVVPGALARATHDDEVTVAGGHLGRRIHRPGGAAPGRAARRPRGSPPWCPGRASGRCGRRARRPSRGRRGRGTARPW